MNRIGILDLGSNLTKLLVADYDTKMTVIHRSIYPTHTLKNAGSGFFDDSSIAQIERDIQLVVDEAKKQDCHRIYGIATSAFRTRSNGEEVIHHLNQKFGIDIQLISGDQEATYIYSGATYTESTNDLPIMVMDIGGGSTEFIIGQKGNILWKHSFNFGSTALLKGIDLSDPIEQNQLDEMQERLKHHLTLLWDAYQEFKPRTLIGTTGAFESFAQINKWNHLRDRHVDTGYVFFMDSLNDELQAMIHSKLNERESNEGIHPMRTPTIHIAAIILQYVLKNTEISSLQLSLGDVKEGLALSLYSKESR